ncbi:unnamed protein product [Onchocerca flexuosa]|uniref:Dolichyl-P-Glc:Glc(2)Man(9)GlcNAc(2)-PP-dolichol alpha-1,2-glucosyltransferase n=1 Tax=Onchocerca flexuosa TaxID=387005 RepID=A0A183H9X0_9BILA|nr:unnamed protein product [Onchocerca flexuosa]
MIYEASLKKSHSHHSVDSYNEETGPGLFPNKAKLPSGIENIRPHLENVDNVPLLVNLFTDCDHFSCQKMIEIMQIIIIQDYGEVVLVVGSSLNYFNSNIFSQGNCSISIEPQHPALCSRKISQNDSELKKASTIATLLMGLCCDIVVFPSQTMDLISLITFCRHQLGTFRSSFLFFLYSSTALTLQQIFTLLFLPNVLSVFQVFLFIVVYIPLLASSLMASSHKFDENRDEIAPKNVSSAPKRTVHRAIIYFSINFLPTLIVVCLIYYSTLLLYLCTLSMGFVHFRDNCWAKYPSSNYYWIATICCIILIQVWN